MNARERFLAIMNFEPVDRPLYWEFSYWAPTVRRWYNEGLEKVDGISDSLGGEGVVMAETCGVDWRNPHHDTDVSKALGFDEGIYRIPANNMYCPFFEVELIEENEESYVVRDSEGILAQVSKINGTRHFMEFPVKDRKDYEKIRYRLQPDNLMDRLPPDWEEIKEKLKDRTYPLMYGGNMGFFNQPRRLMGLERLLTAFYDESELVKMMIDDTVNLLIGIYDPLLSELPGDCAMISEDMCYNAGCFISPDMFKEFMAPAYKKLVGFYRDHGIRAIYIDCDGDVMELIPLLADVQVTGLVPFEVTGKCDIREVRKRYPDFVILGGICKKEVAKGREAIDVELESKIPIVAKGGGFIPFIDHAAPPDISWQNFCYYRKRLAEICQEHYCTDL